MIKLGLGNIDGIDYINSIDTVKKAVNDGIISESIIDKAVTKIIAWKYYKGMVWNQI